MLFMYIFGGGGGGEGGGHIDRVKLKPQNLLALFQEICDRFGSLIFMYLFVKYTGGA